MSPDQSSTVYRTLTVILVIAALSAGGNAIKHTVSCFLLSFVIAYLLDPLMAGVLGDTTGIPTAAVVKVCTGEMRELLQMNVRTE